MGLGSLPQRREEHVILHEGHITARSRYLRSHDFPVSRQGRLLRGSGLRSMLFGGAHIAHRFSHCGVQATHRQCVVLSCRKRCPVCLSFILS